MRVEREDVTRKEGFFYAAYDRFKKGKPLLTDMEKWPWDDPDGIDQKLADSELKNGVLAACRTWRLVEFNVVDLLECAIVNHIFPRKPQSLCRRFYSVS